MKSHFANAIGFTFHNVSINSTYDGTKGIANITFTFHNVSINSLLYRLVNGVHPHLHSTMFLLIPSFLSVLTRAVLYLHSTMFLLIPTTVFTVAVGTSFTFHNVSINSAFF